VIQTYTRRNKAILPLKRAHKHVRPPRRPCLQNGVAVTSDDGQFDPWSVPADISVAADQPGPNGPLTFGDQCMALISFLFVFAGMMLIGLFLGMVVGAYARSLHLATSIAMAVILLAVWLPVSIYVARLNLRATLKLRRRFTVDETTGPAQTDA